MKVDRQTQQLANGLTWVSEFLATPLETKFRPERFTSFAANHWEIPIALVVVYMAFCFFGQKVLRNYNAFDLRLPLAGWNAFLCLFSFLGMCRTVSFV